MVSHTVSVLCAAQQGADKLWYAVLYLCAGDVVTMDWLLSMGASAHVPSRYFAFDSEQSECHSALLAVSRCPDAAVLGVLRRLVRADARLTVRCAGFWTSRLAVQSAVYVELKRYARRVRRVMNAFTREIFPLPMYVVGEAFGVSISPPPASDSARARRYSTSSMPATATDGSLSSRHHRMSSTEIKEAVANGRVLDSDDSAADDDSADEEPGSRNGAGAGAAASIGSDTDSMGGGGLAPPLLLPLPILRVVLSYTFRTGLSDVDGSDAGAEREALMAAVHGGWAAALLYGDLVVNKFRAGQAHAPPPGGGVLGVGGAGGGPVRRFSYARTAAVTAAGSSSSGAGAPTKGGAAHANGAGAAHSGSGNASPVGALVVHTTAPVLDRTGSGTHVRRPSHQHSGGGGGGHGAGGQASARGRSSSDAGFESKAEQPLGRGFAAARGGGTAKRGGRGRRHLKVQRGPQHLKGADSAAGAHANGNGNGTGPAAPMTSKGAAAPAAATVASAAAVAVPGARRSSFTFEPAHTGLKPTVGPAVAAAGGGVAANAGDSLSVHGTGYAGGGSNPSAPAAAAPDGGGGGGAAATHPERARLRTQWREAEAATGKRRSSLFRGAAAAAAANAPASGTAAVPAGGVAVAGGGAGGGPAAVAVRQRRSSTSTPAGAAASSATASVSVGSPPPMPPPGPPPAAPPSQSRRASIEAAYGVAPAAAANGVSPLKRRGLRPVPQSSAATSHTSPAPPSAPPAGAVTSS
jgi:hypothetical protein